MVLQGWVSYNDGALGKVHFISGTIHEHAGACAVAAAVPDAMLVLEPGEIQSHGSFAGSGGGLIVVGGALTLFNADGVVILQGGARLKTTQQDGANSPNRIKSNSLGQRPYLINQGITMGLCGHFHTRPVCYFYPFSIKQAVAFLIST